MGIYQSYIEKTAYPAYLETVETGPGSAHFVECVGDRYLTIGESTLQQPGYQIVSKLWIVVSILVYIVCATILKRREKARQAAQGR